MRSDPTGADNTQDSPRVIAPPPVIYLVALVIGFALHRVLWAPRLAPSARFLGGGLSLLGGVALTGSFVLEFQRRGTSVDVRESATTLVTSGPYRFSRNPGYLGLSLVYAGITLLAGALWPIATLIPTLIMIDRGVIAREERYLERRFGDDYVRFKERTRRWL